MDATTHQKYCKAILQLAPNAVFTLVGEDLENMLWHDANIVRPTNQEIIDAAANIVIETE